MTDRGMTAAELMAELSADPEWVAARARRAAEDEASRRALAAEEAPILADLRRVGIDVPSASALIEWDHYPEAIPILVEHLGRPYQTVIREGLARALATPDARPIWSTLADLYVGEQDPQVKDGLAIAVAQTVTDTTMDDLLALIADATNGTSRVLLLIARFPRRAIEPLERLADDPDLRLEIPVVLKRLRRTPRALRAGPPTPIDPTLREASGSLDRATVPAFLSELLRLGIGLRPVDVKAVRRMVDDLDDDEELELRVEVGSVPGPEPLVIRAFLDDPDAVDLYFFGSAEVAATIQGALEALG